MQVRYKVGKDIVTFQGYYNRTLGRIRGLTHQEVAEFLKYCTTRKDFMEVTVIEADCLEAQNQTTEPIETDLLVRRMMTIWNIVLKGIK